MGQNDPLDTLVEEGEDAAGVGVGHAGQRRDAGGLGGADEVAAVLDRDAAVLPVDDDVVEAGAAHELDQVGRYRNLLQERTDHGLSRRDLGSERIGQHGFCLLLLTGYSITSPPLGPRVWPA